MATLEEIKNLAKVKGLDIEKYDGVRSKIASVELGDISTGEYKGKTFESRQLIVKSENLTDDEDFVVQASEYVPLKLDVKTGEYGIPENPDSKAMKMLAYFKADDFTQIIGKPCQVVKRVKKDREFLGIHTG